MLRSRFWVSLRSKGGIPIHSPAHSWGYSKERDSETGLDYFGARHYGSSLGRFISPDPTGGYQSDPQTLNKYSYVRDTPTVLDDPTGLDFALACVGDTLTCHDGISGRQVNHGGYFEFEPTIVGNDSQGNLVDKTTNRGTFNAQVNSNGVEFNVGGATTWQGIWINNTPTFRSHKQLALWPDSHLLSRTLAKARR